MKKRHKLTEFSIFVHSGIRLIVKYVLLPSNNVGGQNSWQICDEELNMSNLPYEISSERSYTFLNSLTIVSQIRKTKYNMRNEKKKSSRNVGCSVLS
jgi:hypothetical protein